MMPVYDDEGNMTEPRAAALARTMGQQVSELLDALFAEGMTVVEAQALVGFIKTDIDMSAHLCIARQQLGSIKDPVSIVIYGECPTCLDEDCPHSSECANHTTAGDFRLEDGATPILVETGGVWSCTKNPEQTGQGAVLVNGTFGTNWRSQ